MRKPKRDWERLAAYAVLGLVGLVMLLTVWPSLNANGYLAAWDAGGHLLKAEFFANELLAHGQLEGWFPTWHGGFVLFQYYPPLLYYLLGPLTYVFQPELALRLFTAALWIGLLPVTYYFLRSFSIARLPAALGTGLLLSLNSSFGVGLGALYGVGLLPNGLGFILAIWALARLKRDLFDLRPLGKVLLTGVVTALLILAHTFSAYWFFGASLLLAIAAAWGNPTEVIKRIAKRYALVLVTGLVLSAYWWLPLIGSLSGMGETGAIQQQSIGEILKGLLLAQDSGGVVISLLAIGGLAYLGFRRRFRELAFFLAAAAFTLLLSVNAINGSLPFGSVVGSSQFIRFHAFFALLLMVWAAFGIAGAWYFVQRLPKAWRPSGIVGFGVALGLVAALVVAPPLEQKRGFIRVVDNEPTAELRGLSRELSSRLEPGDFVLSEFNWDARFFLGSPHFVNQRLPREVPNVWDLDGNFPEGTPGAEDPVLIASVLPREGYLASQRDYLEDRGVRFIVSTYPSSRPALNTQDWLEPVWQGKILALYEVRDFDRPMGLPPQVGVHLKDVTFSDGEYRMMFDEPVELLAGATLAVSYHPWLRAEASGRAVATEDVNDQLALAESVRTDGLTLAYGPPDWVRGTWAVSVIGGIVLVVGVLKRRELRRVLSRSEATGRRKRRTASRR